MTGSHTPVRRSGTSILVLVAAASIAHATPEHLDHELKLPPWSKSVLGRLRRAVDQDAELARVLDAMWGSDLPSASKLEQLRGLRDDDETPVWVRAAVDTFLDRRQNGQPATRNVVPAAPRPLADDVVMAPPPTTRDRVAKARGALFFIGGAVGLTGFVISLADRLQTDRLGIAGDALLGVGVGILIAITAGGKGRHKSRR